MASGEAYWARMRPLGTLRCRILMCLGADIPLRPAFFAPPFDSVLADAMHRHLHHLYDVFIEDREARTIIAAGLLTFGELDRAEEILDQLPSVPIVTDHGAGWCALVAYTTVAALLPLPSHCEDPKSWIRGSAVSLALQHWFEEQRTRLCWDRASERFLLR